MKINKLKNKVDRYSKIREAKETDNPHGICDDCKFCIIDNKDMPPNNDDFK